MLHHQILFSLAIAEAILMQTSAEQVPSLYRVGPRYFKLVTSSNFLPCMLISALMLFVLLVMILLFSVLTSIPYTVGLSTSLYVLALLLSPLFICCLHLLPGFSARFSVI